MKRVLFAVILTGMITCLAQADVGITDVTRESQRKEKIEWFAVSVTNTPGEPSVLLFTVTISKDAVPQFADGAMLHYRNEKGARLLSVPVAARKQKEGSAQLMFFISCSVLRRCILELTSHELIAEGGPVLIDIYRVKLSTYVKTK